MSVTYTGRQVAFRPAPCPVPSKTAAPTSVLARLSAATGHQAKVPALGGLSHSLTTLSKRVSPFLLNTREAQRWEVLPEV